VSKIELKAVRATGSIEGFLGLLAGKTTKVATIDEINESATGGWAGHVLQRARLDLHEDREKCTLR